MGELSDLAQNLMKHLDPRERQILIYRFGFGRQKPMTLIETGEVMGLTRERIRQIQLKAIRQLRQLMADHGLQKGDLPDEPEGG